MSNATKATEPVAVETERLQGIWFSNSNWSRGNVVELFGLGVGIMAGQNFIRCMRVGWSIGVD